MISRGNHGQTCKRIGVNRGIEKLLKTVCTADELRLAQSVLLPLELGLSIEQTARQVDTVARLGGEQASTTLPSCCSQCRFDTRFD